MKLAAHMARHINDCFRNERKHHFSTRYRLESPSLFISYKQERVNLHHTKPITGWRKKEQANTCFCAEQTTNLT